MRTIPKILDYDRMLTQGEHSPKTAHAHMIHKKTGTKVHVIRDLQSTVRNHKRVHKFGVVQDKLRAMLIEAGV